MNAASQFLRVLAIVGAIAAGVLFYLTNGKVATLQGQLSRANAAATDAKTSGDKALQDANDKLTAALTDEDSAKKDVASAKLEASNEANLKDEAVAALNDSEKAGKDKDDKVSDLNNQVADLTKKAASVGDLQTQVASLTGEFNDLQQKYNDLVQKTTPPATASKDTSSGGFATVAATPPQLSAPFPAKILAVDDKTYLMVLDVGTDDGVQKDTQLYLKVGGQLLGAVIVRDSQAKLSTSEIISTDSMSAKDFFNIVSTKGLQVDVQKAL